MGKVQRKEIGRKRKCANKGWKMRLVFFFMNYRYYLLVLFELIFFNLASTMILQLLFITLVYFIILIYIVINQSFIRNKTIHYIY